MRYPASPSALLRALLVWVGCALPIAPFNTSASIQATSDSYEDALERFNDGDYKTAIIHLKNALQLTADDLSARVLLGHAYLNDGQAAAAEQELLYAREHGAHQDLIAVPLGNAYIQQRKFKRLLDELFAVGYPEDVTIEILVLRGEAHLELGELDEADKAFRDAEQLRSPHAPALLGQALVRLRRGDIGSARTFTDRAIALSSDDAQSWYIKGELDRLSRNLETAVSAYDKAIDLVPEYLQARYGRAAALIDLGRLEAAEVDIQFALDRFQLDPQALYLHALILARRGEAEASGNALLQASAALKTVQAEALAETPGGSLVAGMVAYMQGNQEGAYPYLRRHVDLFPHDAESRKFLGSILLARGEPSKAIEVLEPARALAPNDPQLHTLLGAAYIEIENYPAAQAVLEQAVNLEPKRMDSRMQLVRVLLATGKDDEASIELQSMLATDPESTETALLLGLLHLGRKEFDAARRVANDVIAREPDNLTAINLAGSALFGSGDTAAAREGFERAITVDPSDPAGPFNLAAIESREGNHAAAAKLYHAILEADAEHAPSMIELAKLAEAEDDLEEAIRWRDKARLIETGVTPNALYLVEIHLRAGKPGPALALAQELERLAPENLLVLETLGRAELAAGDADSAKVTFSKSARLAGYDPVRLYRISSYQLAAADAESAEWTLKKAIQGQPDYLPAQSALIQLEIQLGKIEDALERARDLRNRQPDTTLGDVLTGDALMAAGRLEEAEAAYRDAERKEPTFDVVVRLYEARIAAGAQDAAVRELERWSERFPDDIGAKHVLAGAYLRAGKLAAARPIYEVLLAREPNDVQALNNLALIYQAIDDPQALEYAERASTLAPERPEILDTLGWILVQTGDPARGLKHLREAHTRAPQELEIRYHIGVALEKLGRSDEAKAELEAARDGGWNLDDRRAPVIPEARGTEQSAHEPPAPVPPTIVELPPTSERSVPTTLADVSQPQPASGSETLEPKPPESFRVQLGAFRDPNRADQVWREMIAAHPALLGAYAPFVVHVDLGTNQGIWHRLQVGTLDSREVAERLCDELRRSNVTPACIPVTVGAD